MTEQDAVAAADADVLLEAALANYAEDVNLFPHTRSLKPSRYRALHDALVRAGQIAPQPDDFNWGTDAEVEGE